MDSIVTTLPGLTKLRLMECLFKDNKIWKVLEKLVNLKYLFLGVQTKTDKKGLLQNLPTIPSLEFFDSPQIWELIDAENMHILAGNYPNLKEAQFGKVKSVTDEFAEKVAESWKDLRVVDLCK